MDDRARGPKGERFVKDLIVPQGLVIGVEEKVGMALDHAWNEGGPG
jgi:hypothetical protein